MTHLKYKASKTLVYKRRLKFGLEKIYTILLPLQTKSIKELFVRNIYSFLQRRGIT